MHRLPRFSAGESTPRGSGAGEISPIVVALVVAAAVAHATWNLTIKKVGASGPAFLWLTFVVGSVVFLPFGIWSLVDSGADMLHWLPLAAISGLLQVVYFFLLQQGYKVGDVSVVYPLARGTGPLLSVVFAIILLGERPGWIALAGAGIVVAGVITIGLAGGRARRGDNRAGVLFGLVIGVVIAGYTLWDAAAVTVGQMPAVGLYWGSVLFQCLLLSPAALRGTTALRGTNTVGGQTVSWGRQGLLAIAREHWRAILIVGILAPLAYILVLLAIQRAPVSVIAPAREVSVVLVSLAGWLVFREPHPAQRMLGAAIVLVGVAMLAVPG